MSRPGRFQTQDARHYLFKKSCIVGEEFLRALAAGFTSDCRVRSSSFFPGTGVPSPEYSMPCLKTLRLDPDMHSGGHVELTQRIDGLRCRFRDVYDSLVGTDLELLT